MQREGRPDVDAIWIKSHLNRRGNLVKGQPSSYEHTLINLLRDVEPLMGY